MHVFIIIYRNLAHLNVTVIIKNVALCFPLIILFFPNRERATVDAQHAFATTRHENAIYPFFLCFSVFFCEFKVKAALAVKSSYKYEALSLWLPDGNDDEDNNGSFFTDTSCA